MIRSAFTKALHENRDRTYLEVVLIRRVAKKFRVGACGVLDAAKGHVASFAIIRNHGNTTLPDHVILELVATRSGDV